MARQPSEYRHIHDVADVLEPRIERAYLKTIRTLRSRISINALAMLIAEKNPETGAVLLSETDVTDTLVPASNIVRDSVLRGGRIGATEVNKVK